MTQANKIEKYVTEKAVHNSQINALLIKITEAAGVKTEGRQYTTHCFRRGGAQYRFFHAKRRWKFSLLQKWGGWSKGEGPGTISRYLLEEVIRTEDSLVDLLDPDYVSNDFSILDDVNTFHDMRTEVNQALKLVNDGNQKLWENQRKMLKILKKLTPNENEDADEGQANSEGEGGDLAEEELDAGVYEMTNPTYLTPEVLSISIRRDMSRISGWWECIEDWEFGIKGNKPLKDWTEDERKGLAPKYSQRKKVYNEWCVLTNNGEDEERFYEKYPDARDRKFAFGKIRDQIYANHKEEKAPAPRRKKRKKT